MAEPNEIDLVETCYACPEQYDAFYKGKNIGYLRLRHGRFTVEYLPTDKWILDAHPVGDGRFLDEEREHFLNKAREALAICLNEDQNDE